MLEVFKSLLNANSPETSHKLEVVVLFSERKVGDLFDPTLKKKKKDLEKHHIFPRNYLVKNYSYIKDILSHDGKICLNLYINYFFGKLEREKRDTVTGRGYLITEHFTNYPGWIYSDTDEIYIKDSIGIIKKVEEYLNIIEMPYEIKYYKEMLLLDPKKYITIDEFSIGKIYGFRVKNR